MGDLVNLFSWSMSRAEKFRTCPRAYYFHYYGSWGGWERGADPQVRELWLLKKLTSRQAWAGTAVHDAIAWALARAKDTGRIPDVEQTVARMHARMRQEFQESRSGAWRFRRALGLLEHAYDEAVDANTWRENWEHARRCLENFYEAPVKDEILSVPSDQWFPIDSLDTFDLDGVKVYVAPDFAYRDAGGRVHILDWKTGRQKAADRDQVRGYVLFAQDKWQVGPGDAIAELHYLAIPEAVRVDVSDEALEAFRDEVGVSVTEMQSRLLDAEKNLAEASAFEPSASPTVCGRCNFRGACDAAESVA
jgi:hypothetical protein